jgi:AcrR family transcriptional regulator
MTPANTPKSLETRSRILEAALTVFRKRGFENATMRDIAHEAKVATGAAYYYFDSKDELVLAFYERSQAEMTPEIDRRLAAAKTLEQRLQRLIGYRLEYFAPNRKLLGTLSAHADPAHPLSPFSNETAAIRNQDVEFFRRIVEDSRVKLPKNIAPYLPHLLWLYQMGLILFWVYDPSERQARTKVLFEKTLKIMIVTLRLASLPIMHPLHRLAAELLHVIYGDIVERETLNTR